MSPATLYRVSPRYPHTPTYTPILVTIRYPRWGRFGWVREPNLNITSYKPITVTWPMVAYPISCASMHKVHHFHLMMLTIEEGDVPLHTSQCHCLPHPIPSASQTNVNTRIHAYAHTRIRAYTKNKHIHSCIIRSRTNMHTWTHMHMQSCSHTDFALANMQTHIHTHMHIYIHTTCESQHMSLVCILENA